MSLKCRTFFSPSMSHYVLFTESVLSHMYAHAQRKMLQTEAGGEIYSPTPFYSSLIINDVTGPHPQDRRRRYSFNPDVEATTRARYAKYEQGLHAVGLWHTHPELHPAPSGPDKSTTEEYLRAFRGDRERYLTVIIGNRGEVPAMTVWSAEKCGKWVRWNERHNQLPELP